MAEAFVYALSKQLGKTMYQEIQQEVRQVVGVEREVEKMTSTLEVIQAALIDAEERQVKEKVVKDWLEKLSDVCYDMDDVLDDWSTAIFLESQIEGVENDFIFKKVCSYIYSLCLCFSQVGVRHDIACKVKELNDRLDAINSEKNQYHFKLNASTKEPEQRRTASFIDESEVYGRADAKKSIVNQLLCESSREKKGLHIISIVGMGGIGKTTLAQLAYNDGAVNDHFDQRIWVCVSDPFDEIRIAKLIVKGLDGNDPSSLDWENLPQQIHESTKGKKILLVLDDVWLDDESTEAFRKWETLKHSLSNGARGSTILVTTRNEKVATIMGTTYTCPLGELSNDECWTIFRKKAFSERSREDRKKLKEIGKEIANKCKGLPLAAKTLGGLMRFKKSKEEWENVLNSKIWELKVAEIGIFSHLFLSYNDLPWEQKPCFSYCAIFQKDYEIQVDYLIRLWMAQGYLNPRRPGEEMETIGREYFENLAMRSFFQDFKKDGDGSIISCKMHDIVHDFAQFLTKKECFRMEVDGAGEPSVDSFCGKTRHLTVEPAAKAPLPLSIYSRKNLRTLFVANNSGPSIIQPDLFHHLKCLRALDLSRMRIKELPREVENLMHLRYLNLSWNKFKELPETVCNLCNLQTLNLDDCESLQELPKGMGKLINLRHLRIHYILRSMPKGIGRLSSLQTLSRFIISGSHEREGCTLGDLKDLNSLRGELYVGGLGNVEDASEAEKADLKRKKHLRRLELDFDCEDGAEVAGGGKMCEVIEALQPHSNLESLIIWRYRGSVFPNWMVLLPNLKTIDLNGCPDSVCLPPLGKLPSLESLEIWGMDSVKKVGIEFLGIGIDASLIIAFPMLKHLSFLNMYEWEDWDGMITKRREEDKITIMPSLHSLEIKYCPKLKALPHHLQTMKLEKLEIFACPILKARCQKEIGEDWANISHIPNIIIKDSIYG